MKKAFIILLSLFASGIVSTALVSSENIQKKTSLDLRDGDLIFQSSHSGQSRAIQLATHSKYSHVGMLFQENGKWMVLEAIQPVCITPLENWVARGGHQHFVIKRLKNASEILSAQKIQEMRKIGKSYLGKNYDIYFEWSDEKIYCSELVWKIYKEVTGIELGNLQPLRTFDFSNPIVQSIAAQRYGNNIPKDELAISPGEMFNSIHLKTIEVVNDF